MHTCIFIIKVSCCHVTPCVGPISSVFLDLIQGLLSLHTPIIISGGRGAHLLTHSPPPFSPYPHPPRMGTLHYLHIESFILDWASYF
jgi:hypothetical protein